jgi:hypothetical protein
MFGQAQKCILVIPEFGRLRQENHKFKASLTYIAGPYSKKKKEKKTVRK